MVLEPILCPACGSSDIVKHGQSGEGKQRYKCRNSECCRSTFIRDYVYRGYLPQVKQQITDMAVNGSGIRDTARVLKISRTKVIETLKKDCQLKVVNEARSAQLEPTQTIVQLCQWHDVEAEADEMWSYVGSKNQQRWLWHAYALGGAKLYDHQTDEVLAYVLSNHQDSAFLELKALLEPFGIMQFYTVRVACRRLRVGRLCWHSLPEASRHLEPAHHTVGKRNTSNVELRSAEGV